MKLIKNFNETLNKLYNHVGFVPDWVICPIDDCTDKFWYVDNDNCKYANTEEQFYSDGDYYLDDIYKQCFYSKYVYKGKELTMVMCNPHDDGVCYFRFFDNKKFLEKCKLI